MAATEYAIMQGGRVVNIVMTSRVMDDAARAAYPGAEVVPLDDVPDRMLEQYEYWAKRP